MRIVTWHRVVIGVWLLATAAAWSAEGAAPAEPARFDLAASLKYAFANSPRMRGAAHQVQQAEARVRQARAQRGATLGVSGGHTRMGPLVSFTIPDSTGGPPRSLEVGLDRLSTGKATLQKILYAGGALRAGERAAVFGRTAATHDRDTVRQELAFDVTNAYVSVLKALAMQQVAEQSLAQVREHRRLAQVRLDVGVVPRFDVIRSEVEVSQAEERLVQARNGVALSKAAFNTVLGRDANAEVELELVDVKPGDSPNLVAAQTAAKERRPELRSLRAKLAAARQGVQAAKAGLRPSVVASADYSRQSPTSTFQDDYSWHGTLALELPLFDSGLTRAKAKEAHETVNELESILDLAEQGVALEVKQAALNVDAAQQRITTAAAAITQAQEAFRLATLRYQNGVGTNVEVTDAQVALTVARITHVNALYDYMLAEAALRKATGAMVPED